MGSLQPRNQVADRRTEPDEERAADSSMVFGRSDPLDDFVMPLDDPNEEITEQWQEGLHEWCICRDEQCSVEPARISCDVSQRRSSHSFCPCLKRRAGSSAQTMRYRRHVNVTPTVPQETLVLCFHRSHQLLPGSNAVSLYLTCQRTGPTFQESPELQRMVLAWWAKLQRRQG